jgi:hypothetical protein
MNAADFRRIALSLEDPHLPSPSERGCAGRALRTAWRLRVEKNTETKKTKRKRTASRR